MFNGPINPDPPPRRFLARLPPQFQRSASIFWRETNSAHRAQAATARGEAWCPRKRSTGWAPTVTASLAATGTGTLTTRNTARVPSETFQNPLFFLLWREIITLLISFILYFLLHHYLWLSISQHHPLRFKLMMRGWRRGEPCTPPSCRLWFKPNSSTTLPLMVTRRSKPFNQHPVHPTSPKASMDPSVTQRMKPWSSDC